MSNIEKHGSARHQQSKILAGTLVIIFGTLFLLDRSDVNIPHWVISWETIVITIGFWLLYKHRMQKISGFIMIGVGTLFLINEFRPHTIDSKYLFPVIVIFVGVMMIGKTMNLFGMKKKKTTIFDESIDQDSEDFIKSTTLFGGVKKTVVSKNFQGADFTTSFGGTEINLSQADIQHPVTINASTSFGGLKVIVPSSWEVNSEIVAVFGSVEDNRAPISEVNRDPNKVLTIKGDCVFGGVEILSYV